MINYQQTLTYLQNKISEKPEIAIILGTGLNNLADIVKDPVSIPYEEIPGFVQSTAPSHKGRLVAGKISGKQVILMQGRLHFYEGYCMDDVTYPVRIFAKLGVKYLFVTNAAGSLNKNLVPGSVVALEDHINFMGTNPLIGRNKEEFGERFPSMHNPYDQELRNKAFEISRKLGFTLFSGVYTAVTGPSLETKAECLMIKNFGSDLVGMSTVPEVIVAIHSGLRVFATSVVTNLSNIFHSNPHSQEEIRENADLARKNLENLFIELISQI